MLDGTAYLSPVMSMSVAKPVTSKRSKRFADSFDEFDMMEKRQVKIFPKSVIFATIYLKNERFGHVFPKYPLSRV